MKKLIVLLLELLFMAGFVGLFLFGSAGESNFSAAIIGLVVSMFVMLVTVAVLERIGGGEDG